MADSKPPHDAAATGGWSGRFGEPVSDRVKRYTASVDFDRRLADADIAGSLAHARMLAAVGVLAADDLAAIERGMDAIRWRDRARRISVVAATSRMSISTSRSASPRSSATPASACTPDARATTRSPPTCGSGCAREIDVLADGLRRCGARSSTSRSSIPRRSCPATRTCRSRSPSLLVTICSPTRRCSPATPSGSATAAGASTGCRWEAPRSPARAFRSTAPGSRGSWDSRRSAPIRSTPFRIATSPSNSPPPRRSR